MSNEWPHKTHLLEYIFSTYFYDNLYLWIFLWFKWRQYDYSNRKAHFWMYTPQDNCHFKSWICNIETSYNSFAFVHFQINMSNMSIDQHFNKHDLKIFKLLWIFIEHYEQLCQYFKVHFILESVHYALVQNFNHKQTGLYDENTILKFRELYY